jgi:hypothetical protein
MLDCSSDSRALSPDALSEVLQDLRLSDGSYGRCELTRPWGIDFPPVAQARFHFVVSGDCWLRAPKRGWMELHAGDVVLLPHGTGHALSGKARGRVKPLEEIDVALRLLGALRVGGGRIAGALSRSLAPCMSRAAGCATTA